VAVKYHMKFMFVLNSIQAYHTHTLTITDNFLHSYTSCRIHINHWELQLVHSRKWESIFTCIRFICTILSFKKQQNFSVSTLKLYVF